MTKEQQRGEDRGAQGVTVHDKDKHDKGAKHAKASASEQSQPAHEAHEAHDVVLVKQQNADESAVDSVEGKLSRLLSSKAFHPKAWNLNLNLNLHLPLNLNTEAWIKPVQSTWTGLVRKATAKPIRVDVISRSEDILVRAEVPGISKDRLDLAITSNALTIRGQASTVEAGDYIKRELPSGEFSRHVPLPVAVQTDKASATIRHGFLEVVLPKSSKDGEQKIAIH